MHGSLCERIRRTRKYQGEKETDEREQSLIFFGIESIEFVRAYK